jgi:competence protein ComEC
MRIRLPEPPARSVLAVLALVWFGVLCGRSGVWILGAGLGLISLALHVRRVIPIFVSAGLFAGTAAGALVSHREQQILTAQVPESVVSVVAVALTDSRPSPFGGVWFLARPYLLVIDGADSRWKGPPMMVVSEESAQLDSGDHIRVIGSLTAKRGLAGGTPYTGRLRAGQIEVIRNGGALMAAGNGLRHRVIDRLASRGPPGALLSGFLVGDTTRLPASDVDALRQAGISHFVAVSGANVAGFLLIWWLLLGPLGVGPRRRGLLGLLALAVFMVATRWEPSVVRASLMAGVVLGGRVVGIPFDSWAALGSSGTLALLVSPELAGDLGFQLSVLATMGIMAGADLLPETLPGLLRKPLGATLSAQVAVTPLLLVNFGAVPLASPLTNLLAAPLVAAATLLGGLGTVAGIEPALTVALAVAGTVLDLAHWASWFPQMGALGAGFLLVGVLALRVARLRPLVAMSAAVAIFISLLPQASVVRPTAVFLDVGQGDSVLLLGSDGVNVLVDGGPDPVILAAALRRYQIRHLDLLVLTHPHDDHTAGLVGLATRLPISRLWYSGPPHSGLAWEMVVREADAAGVPIEVPVVGRIERMSELTIKVLGPLRRYEGPNDQSVVLLVQGGGASILMTGDIELAAQQDLGPIEADVLNVPHQGGATSDLSWLQSVDPDLAVISVGVNDYGHPNEQVVATLEEAGAIVVRTDQTGDLVVPLVGDPFSLLPVAVSGQLP